VPVFVVVGTAMVAAAVAAAGMVAQADLELDLGNTDAAAVAAAVAADIAVEDSQTLFPIAQTSINLGTRVPWHRTRLADMNVVGVYSESIRGRGQHARWILLTLQVGVAVLSVEIQSCRGQTA
jgi:uncharacterized protein YabE (DUF348 family)